MTVNVDDIPMMFRAQIDGRCQLNILKDKDELGNRIPDEKKDQSKWIKEWVDPQEMRKPYQYIDRKGKNGLQGNIYHLFIKFDYRLITDSGQDTIVRPIWGKNGIPFIPGSTVKGWFRRVCNQEEKDYYCGNQDSNGKIRFYGAYPVGNWTGKNPNGYTILDLVHPQQNKQVKSQDSTSAYPMISLEKPELMFRFSSTDENIDWDRFKQLFDRALSQGLGGKTSIGYGFTKNQIPDWTKEDDTLQVTLQGEGLASSTLDGNAEFRPNLFKASLRGHLTRLFAGVCNDENIIDRNIEQLFGNSDGTGLVKLFWRSIRYSPPKDLSKDIYNVRGNLYLSTPPPQQELLKKVLQFAYVMAGFGKSWRRVSHHQFFQSYLKNNFAIGCHWICNDNNFIEIKDLENLKTFLSSLYRDCQNYLQITTPQRMTDWREAWHPDNVKVYAQKVEDSQVVTLFHEDRFKFTPAIGGKNRGDNRPKYVSHVWHRMLPVSNNDYLEIVTIFKGDTQNWNGNKSAFERAIRDLGLILIWGNNSS